MAGNGACRRRLRRSAAVGALLPGGVTRRLPLRRVAACAAALSGKGFGATYRPVHRILQD